MNDQVDIEKVGKVYVVKVIFINYLYTYQQKVVSIIIFILENLTNSEKGYELNVKIRISLIRFHQSFDLNGGVVEEVNFD